jgi:hypothetical protein
MAGSFSISGNDPGGFGGGNIALAILGFPGEALAHDVITDLFRETAEEQLFARAVTALDELHHAALHAMPHGSRQHAEGGTALALAVAGQYQQQSRIHWGSWQCARPLPPFCAACAPGGVRHVRGIRSSQLSA